MYRPTRLFLLCVLATSASASFAQHVVGPLGTITIEARRNPGDVPYYFFWQGQKELRAFLPPEPRMVDVSYRILFTELPEAERDAYLPRNWGVSVVSKSVDETVVVRRGGYFTLADLPVAADENATIMFKEQTRWHAIGVSWVLRVSPDQRIGYADFRRAMWELRYAQRMIPLENKGLATVKQTQYDGIKACFLAPGGSIKVGGEAAGDGRIGNCLMLKYDGALAASGKTIEFVGPLDIVTLVETRL